MKNQKMSIKLCIFCLILVVAMLFNLTSCVSTKVNAETVDLMKGISAANEQITENDETLNEFRKNMFNFTAELFKRSVNGEKNSLISPMSAIMALSMTANGAGGDTLDQAQAVLGDLDVMNHGLYFYRKNLNSQARIANSIWIKNLASFKVERDFLEKNATYYDSDAFLAPFDDGTVSKINKWTADNTDNMIKKIIDEIGPDTMMCLVNTVLFEAKWQQTYNRTKSGVFHNINGEKEKAEMMTGTESYYIKDESSVGFFKYYEDMKYSFVAILPNQDIPLCEFVASLSGEALQELLDSKKSARVLATIPKFSYDYELSLKKPLIDMGWDKAFDGRADFSGISSTPLLISEVLHKTHIELDENGTKAAAATAVIMDKTAAILPDDSIEITLDRPFMYIIYDNVSEVPLFIGTVNSIK